MTGRAELWVLLLLAAGSLQFHLKKPPCEVTQSQTVLQAFIFNDAVFGTKRHENPLVLFPKFTRVSSRINRNNHFVRIFIQSGS